MQDHFLGSSSQVITLFTLEPVELSLKVRLSKWNLSLSPRLSGILHCLSLHPVFYRAGSASVLWGQKGSSCFEKESLFAVFLLLWSGLLKRGSTALHFIGRGINFQGDCFYLRLSFSLHFFCRSPNFIAEELGWSEEFCIWPGLLISGSKSCFGHERSFSRI